MQPSQFKYYIHDSVESFRLQLLGTFTAAEVKELEGCWTTAKPTLANRKLVLDVSELESMDEAGRKWVAVMVAEGAELIERRGMPGTRPPKPSLLKRLAQVCSPDVQQYVGSPECEK